MRIALLAGDSETYWLAGQAGVSERVHSSTSGLHIIPKIQVQEDNLIRSANAVVYDRKNLTTNISFGTTRVFDTPAAAEAWSLGYDANMPRTGTLILESQLTGGGVSRQFLAGAVVHPPSRQVTGCSVQLQYSIIGGAITTDETITADFWNTDPATWDS